MIKEFVDVFMNNKDELRDKFATHPKDYKDVVKRVVHVISEKLEARSRTPDPERITEINYGDYQGTLVYVIGDGGYQPSRHWTTVVDYGSCSGCDTLEAIRDMAWNEDAPTEEQINDYMTLALHLIQKMKLIENS